MLGATVVAQLPGASASPESAVGAGAEEITLRLLYQLIVILLATRLVTVVVRRLGQTDVSGEILAGLLLGPSLLGALFPNFMHELFPASTGTIFTGLAQVGLAHRVRDLELSGATWLQITSRQLLDRVFTAWCRQDAVAVLVRRRNRDRGRGMRRRCS